LSEPYTRKRVIFGVDVSGAGVLRVDGRGAEGTKVGPVVDENPVLRISAERGMICRRPSDVAMAEPAAGLSYKIFTQRMFKVRWLVRRQRALARPREIGGETSHESNDIGHAGFRSSTAAGTRFVASTESVCQYVW
jgi:hypothetical protein